MGVTLLENKFHLTSLSEYGFSEVNSMYTVLGTWVAAEQERKGAPDVAQGLGHKQAWALRTPRGCLRARRALET